MEILNYVISGVAVQADGNGDDVQVVEATLSSTNDVALSASVANATILQLTSVLYYEVPMSEVVELGSSIELQVGS